MIVALLLAVCAQAPATPPRIADVEERRIFEEAQQALLEDATALAGHRGLNAFLAANNTLRQWEDNFRGLMELPSFHVAQENFEEVLLSDADARKDFREHIGRLARDGELGLAIAKVIQAENSAPHGIQGLPEAFAFLRAHPYVALAIASKSERLAQLPQEVRPLNEAFGRDEKLRPAFSAAWNELNAHAGAREAVYPWWARVYGGQSAAAQRYRALEAELAPFPSHALAWERREFVWANQVNATIAWRDYVYGLIRRNAVLEPIYFRYLRTLRERPDIAAYADAQFDALHGRAPSWPPEGLPPRLPSWQRPEAIKRPTTPGEPSAKTPNTPTVKEPTRPTAQRPTTPTPPTAPERSQQKTTP